MYTSPGIFTILFYFSLLSSILAAPNAEDAQPTAGKSTKTVVITLTRTIEPPSSSTSTRTPDKPESLPAPLNQPLKPNFQTRTRKPLTVTCPHSTEACIIDSIAIWPTGTTGHALPSFTLGTRDAAPTKAPHTVSTAPKASLCSKHKHPHARPSDFTFPTTSTSTSKSKAEPSYPAPAFKTATPTPPLPSFYLPTIQDPARAKLPDRQGEGESGRVRRSAWGNSTVRMDGVESVGLDPVAWAGQE